LAWYPRPGVDETGKRCNVSDDGDFCSFSESL